MLMFVCSFVSSLSRAVNLHLSMQRAIRAIKEPLESNQRAIRVIQSEPKILRLVHCVMSITYCVPFLRGKAVLEVSSSSDNNSVWS